MVERSPPPTEPGAPAGDQDAARLALAFAPLHKRAFGIAVGTAAALVVFALTVLHLVVKPTDGLDLWLLAQYLYGYEPTWRGAFIGAFWGGVVGFVSGWFVAFCRNLAVAVSLFLTLTKAELQETRDFLDHI